MHKSSAKNRWMASMGEERSRFSVVEGPGQLMGKVTLTAENGVKESQEESTKAGVLLISLGEFL